MERFLLVHFAGILLGFIIVVFAVATSVGGLLLVRRRIALATLRAKIRPPAKPRPDTARTMRRGSPKT